MINVHKLDGQGEDKRGKGKEGKRRERESTHINLVMFITNAEIMKQGCLIQEHEGTVVIHILPVILLTGERAGVG